MARASVGHTNQCTAGRLYIDSHVVERLHCPRHYHNLGGFSFEPNKDKSFIVLARACNKLRARHDYRDSLVTEIIQIGTPSEVLQIWNLCPQRESKNSKGVSRKWGVLN